MNRRNLIKSLTISSGALAAGSLPYFSKAEAIISQQSHKLSEKGFHADLIIAGGGLGGCAAALAALRNGLSVIMTEETDWIGGQLTQQGLSCPDEHPWIEHFGCTQSYRDLRNHIREYYLRYYPLTDAARTTKYLNPGNGSVSRLCHEPRVALAVLYELLMPYLSSRKLIILLKHKALSADMDNDKVKAITVQDLNNGNALVLSGPYFMDATELGDLLPLTGTEYITGTESRQQTHELHAAEKADPANQQAFTLCLAMDYVEKTNNVIDKPEGYDFWKNYVPQLTPPWSGHLLDFNMLTLAI